MARKGNSAVCRSSVVSLVLVISAAAQAPPAKDVPTLARETSPSVVRILVRDQGGAELAAGSGFVVSSDGKIVTNYHVVHVPGMAQAEARFTDGASYQIQGVIASDPIKDLAVLRLQAVGKEFTGAQDTKSPRTVRFLQGESRSAPRASLTPSEWSPSAASRNFTPIQPAIGEP